MKSNKSLIKNTIIYFILFIATIILTFLLVNKLVDYRFDNSFLYIDDLLSYEDLLRNDEYDKLPLNKFKHNNFLVYNEDFEVLYSTDTQLNNIIVYEDLEFINDYYDSSYYTVYEKNIKNEKFYHIIKSKSSENGTNEYVDFAYLDRDYNILNGNLFGDRKSLTEREFTLIEGNHTKGISIEKASYETIDEEKRIIVFLSKELTTNELQKAINNINQTWIYFIPIFIAIILIYAYLIVSNIKKSLEPINIALENYEKNNEFSIENSKISKEFIRLIYNFKRIFNKLKREEEKKNEIYLERSRIFANLSHDLKIPLTVIEGYSKAFLDGIVPTNKERIYLEAIYNKCEEATNVINSLLEFTKYDNNGLDINLEDVNLSEYFTKYLANKYSDIEIAKFKLDVKIPSTKIIYKIDKKIMNRMLDNLISNALKYNEKGTTIYFKLEKIKKTIRITVADNGVGIKDELKDNIFNPFVSGDSSRGSNTGTGLGLAIVKRAVEINGGTIRLVKKPHKPYKTEFIVEFLIS